MQTGICARGLQFQVICEPRAKGPIAKSRTMCTQGEANHRHPNLRSRVLTLGSF